jgi:cell division protein FtsA
MSGTRLEVDMHVISGSFDRLRNAVRVVKNMEIDVEDLAFNGLAASLALLTNDQKELGTLVIDMGAGTTDYALYYKGIVRHTGVLAVGGDHVSNDIAHGLKVPLRRADKLKLDYGTAMPDSTDPSQTLTINNDIGQPLATVNLDHLRQVMSLRLEEIFEIIAQDVHRAGLLDHLRGGVLLCGGSSNIPNITALAKRVFGTQVSVGSANGISGLTSSINRPEFATGIGLVKFRSLRIPTQQSKKTIFNSVRNTLGNMLGSMRMFLT